MTLIVDFPPKSDYTLVITSAGDLEARRPLPGDRVHRFSTAENDVSYEPQTQSEFRLSIDEVIDRYEAHANPDASRFQLAVDTAAAYKYRSIRYAGDSPQPRVAEDDTHDSATDAPEEASDVEMSEHQRRVLSPDTDDGPATPAKNDDSSTVSRLTQARELLNQLDSTQLDTTSKNHLDDALNAIDALIRRQFD